MLAGVRSHTFRQERESDQSQRLEAFRCGPQMVVVNSVKQRKVNFGWQPAVWKQPGGGTKESLPLSQTAGTSMLENIIHSVSDEYIGTFFPDLLAGSSSAEALSQGVQWMVFVGGEIGAPSNSFAPLVSVPVHKQGKAKRMPRPPATKRAQEAVCLGVVDDASLELFCIQCD